MSKLHVGSPSFERDVISHGDGFEIRDARINVEYDPYDDMRRISFRFDIYVEDRPNLLGLFKAVAFSTVTFLARAFAVSPPTPEDLYGGTIPVREKKDNSKSNFGFNLGRRKMIVNDDET